MGVCVSPVVDLSMSENKDSLYANSYVDSEGLQDHWNFTGRPSYIIMEPGQEEIYLMFNRYIGASW